MIEWPRSRNSRRRIAATAAPAAGYLAIACLWASLAPASLSRAQSSAAASQKTQAPAPETSTPALPRGKKLVLKDGSFQMVREYQVNGDRVRYYSLDSSQWEEIPEDLVDWDATKKAVAEEAQHDAALAERVHLREQGRHAEQLDIDASVEVAKGVFLPPGEGLFLFDGHTVAHIAQAETSSTLNKGHEVAKILAPIPLPTRFTISVAGPHALFRIHGGQAEFYRRSATDAAPNLQLIRAKVHSKSREFEHLDELFGEKELSAKTVPIQAWEIAPGLYRFTLSQDLALGEYGIAEVLPGSAMEIHLWDFGVDPKGEPLAPKTK
jgi:hypothetical protein